MDGQYYNSRAVILYDRVRLLIRPWPLSPLCRPFTKNGFIAVLLDFGTLSSSLIRRTYPSSFSLPFAMAPLISFPLCPRLEKLENLLSILRGENTLISSPPDFSSPRLFNILRLVKKKPLSLAFQLQCRGNIIKWKNHQKCAIDINERVKEF